MPIICPSCNRNVTHLFKCNICGNVRCDSTTSNAGKGACGSQHSPFGRPEAASTGKICYICKKGKYQKL